MARGNSGMFSQVVCNGGGDAFLLTVRELGGERERATPDGRGKVRR